MSASEKCIKYLMFFFNFLFLICGLTLIITGAMAQTDYIQFNEYLDVTVHAPALLITVGVFIFVISFLGCCGAIRDNYYMLMGFAVLLGLLFVLSLAGGIAGYVEKKDISAYVGRDLDKFVANYWNSSNVEHNRFLDMIQKDRHCCGSTNFTDYKTPLNESTTYTVPETCCRSAFCVRDPSTLAKSCTDKDPNNPVCPIYPNGCKTVVEDVLEYGVSTVAGFAIVLAFIELIGLGFSCFLARRIRNGYTYA